MRPQVLDHPDPIPFLENSGPLVRRLPSTWTPEYCFDQLAPRPGCVWLDSAVSGGELGRYSYMAAEPFSLLRIDSAKPDSLHQVASAIARYSTKKIPDIPPMQGGWMGWFGYEMGRCFETIPSAQYDEFQLPVASLGLYDVVLSWDHKLDQGWIVSQGWPQVDSAKRQEQAYRRLVYFLSVLESDSADTFHFERFHLPRSQVCPQFPTRWSDSWTSNFSAAGYRAAVKKCTDYIHAGDVFQVNLSQRLLRVAATSSAQLYRHLREVNPAPFAGYADFGRTQVISSSPERFLQLEDLRIQTRPIKGTRPRLSDPVADAGMAELLRNSEKDRSENVMIVDLMRNDLSKISTPESVRVDSLCEIEQYAYVWHLVSVIQSQLDARFGPTDLLEATFPGGSITGAPKIRAMEIIAELEPTARGPYCGSLGYVSFAGEMDLNILIRTITACEGWWQIPVGGGIVADSNPELEEQETWHKAEGMLKAIDSLESASKS